MRFSLAGAAAILLLFTDIAARAQEEGPPAGAAIPGPTNAEARAGYYEMTLTVAPANCLTQSVGGTARGIVEVTAGRRENLIVHLERLNSLFAGPVPVRIDEDSQLSFGGQVPIIVAGIRMGVRGNLSGAFERGRERFRADFELAARLCKITGTIEGLKTNAPPPPPPAPAPAETPTGALLNSDGYVAPAPAEPAPAGPLPPSPLINGNYATTLTVTESRCFSQDLRGTWRGVAELQPQPGIVIPLQNFAPLFAAPVTIEVQGLTIRQSTQIQLQAGAISGGVPADFDGAFRNDGGEFNVRFTAGTPLCRIKGTISGIRS